MKKKTKISLNWRRVIKTTEDFFVGILWGMLIQYKQPDSSVLNWALVTIFAIIAFVALFMDYSFENKKETKNDEEGIK